MSPVHRRDNPATLASAVWLGLHLPPRKAVRDELVTTLVDALDDAITIVRVSDTQAYAAFLRTVTILNVYVVKEERR